MRCIQLYWTQGPVSYTHLIVSRRERDRLQHGGCDSRAEAEHTADGQVGTGKDDDARDAVGQNALRGSLLQDGDQVADGEEVRLDGNDDNKEQKQDVYKRQTSESAARS